MAQIATIIGVISLVGCILLYIIRGSGPDTIEGTRHVAEDKGIDTPLRPPALPKQDGKKNLTCTDITSYPKCPICRCHNIYGSKQMVFRDGTRWRCVNGHRYDI